jgi:hypothetical protein
MCIVVNVREKECDVFIGRPSKWGNPYSHVKGTPPEFKVKDRSEAITKFESYLLSNKELMDALHELKYKKLGCFCKPLRCHGDIIKKYVDRLEMMDQNKLLINDDK